jgi:hypothetical protein
VADLTTPGKGDQHRDKFSQWSIVDGPSPFICWSTVDSLLSTVGVLIKSWQILLICFFTFLLLTTHYSLLTSYSSTFSTLFAFRFKLFALNFKLSAFRGEYRSRTDDLLLAKQAL